MALNTGILITIMLGVVFTSSVDSGNQISSVRLDGKHLCDTPSPLPNNTLPKPSKLLLLPYHNVEGKAKYYDL